MNHIDRIASLLTEDPDIINELNLGGRPVKLSDHSANPFASKQARNHPPTPTAKTEPTQDELQSAKPARSKMFDILSRIHADSQALEGTKTGAGKAYLAAPPGFNAAAFGDQLSTMKANTITINDIDAIKQLADKGAAARQLDMLLRQLNRIKLNWGKPAIIIGNNLPEPFMQWVKYLAKTGTITYGPSTIVGLSAQAKARMPTNKTSDKPIAQKQKDIGPNLKSAQKEFDPKASAVFDEIKGNPKNFLASKRTFVKNYITPVSRILLDVGRFLTAASKSKQSADNNRTTLAANVHNAIKTMSRLQAAASAATKPAVSEDRRALDLGNVFNKMKSDRAYIGAIDKLVAATDAYRKNELSRQETATHIMSSTEVILSNLNDLFDSLKKLARAGIETLEQRFPIIAGRSNKSIEMAKQQLPISTFKSWLKSGLSASEIMTIFNIGPHAAAKLSKEYIAQLK